MLPRPKIDLSDEIKPMWNVGALMDIPTGHYENGQYGDSILNGGLPLVSAIAGPPNIGKTILAEYMAHVATNNFLEVLDDAYLTEYDSEANKVLRGNERLIARHAKLVERDAMNTGIIEFTDITKHYGNEWWAKVKEQMDEKVANKKSLTYQLPIVDKDGKPISVIQPSGIVLDSLSEFTTEANALLQDSNELGEGGGNMVHAKSGGDKTRFLMELPRMTGRSNTFIIMTAHIGEVMNFNSSPYAPQPVKMLKGLPSNIKIKGIPRKADYLLQSLWYLKNLSYMVNQTTKAEEYPLEKEEFQVIDKPEFCDLREMLAMQLRGKSGVSDYSLPIVYSQKQGVLPSLTEFNYLKNYCNRFGLSEGKNNYSMLLYPSVNLSRTTVRTKIDNDYKLRRAINFTSELAQAIEHRKIEHDLLCTPADLFNDIKTAGYDWDELLETRGYYLPNDHLHKRKRLSLKDLLKMRKGLYKPYWKQ